MHIMSVIVWLHNGVEVTYIHQRANTLINIILKSGKINCMSREGLIHWILKQRWLSIVFVSVIMYLFAHCSVLHPTDNRCWSLSLGLWTSTPHSANSAEQKARWSSIFLFACLILWSQLVSSCQHILYATCQAPINRPLFDLNSGVLLSWCIQSLQ